MIKEYLSTIVTPGNETSASSTHRSSYRGACVLVMTHTDEAATFEAGVLLSLTKLADTMGPRARYSLVVVGSHVVAVFKRPGFVYFERPGLTAIKHRCWTSRIGVHSGRSRSLCTCGCGQPPGCNRQVRLFQHWPALSANGVHPRGGKRRPRRAAASRGNINHGGHDDAQ